MNIDDEPEIKIILLGEKFVGKTSLIKVASGEKFDPNVTPSLTCSNKACTYKAPDNKEYKYYLWDTAGQEYFRSLNNVFMKNAKIVILVFAVDDKSSFQSLNYWLEQAKNNNTNFITGLIGNKMDLLDEQVVTDKDAKTFAKEHDIKYILTSAKTDDIGIKNFIEELLNDYLNKYYNPSSKNYVKLNGKKNNSKSKCC